MKTIKIKCKKCTASNIYTWKDLDVVILPDDIEVNMYCKSCNDPEIGSQDNLEELLKYYPQKDDQEPDEDLDYDRLTVEQVERKLK